MTTSLLTPGRRLRPRPPHDSCPPLRPLPDLSNQIVLISLAAFIPGALGLIIFAFYLGISIWRHTHNPLMRIVGPLSPALMVTAVVLTANHYIIDTAAGPAIAFAGLAAASALQTRQLAESTWMADRAVSRHSPVRSHHKVSPG